MRVNRIFLVASPFLAALPVQAQEREAARVSSSIDAILACRQIPDPAPRIACFDRTTLALEAASKRTEIVLVDREDTEETRRAQFGYAPRQIRPFGLGRDDDNQINEITSEIVSLSGARYPNIRFRIKDGSVWETTQGTRNFPPRVGETVAIKRGPLGNYLAAISGRISLRVMRVE